MKATGIHDQTNQENVSPDAASHDSCQGAALQLVPPTPVGTAPMQAAAMSVAAKGQQTLAGTWAAPLPAAGRTVVKQRVQQAAMMRERSWTPLGARMPLSPALPPSSVKPTTARGGMLPLH